MRLLAELFSAILFTFSTGLLFSERFRQKRGWVVLAAFVAIASTYLTIDQIVEYFWSKTLIEIVRRPPDESHSNTDQNTSVIEQFKGVLPKSDKIQREQALTSVDTDTQRLAEQAEIAKLKAQLERQEAQAAAEKAERERVEAKKEAERQRRAADDARREANQQRLAAEAAAKEAAARRLEAEQEAQKREAELNTARIEAERKRQIEEESYFIFSVCNKTSSQISVAVDYYSEQYNARVVEGWKKVDGGQCNQLGKFKKGEFHFFAKDQYGPRQWGGDFPICVEFPGPFSRVRTSATPCDPRWLKKFNTRYVGKSSWTANINP